MDGSGREQDLGHSTGHPLPDDARIDGVPETLVANKKDGDEPENEGGRLATAEGKQAVRNQSVVSPDDYAGTSESGA